MTSLMDNVVVKLKSRPDVNPNIMNNTPTYLTLFTQLLARLKEVPYRVVTVDVDSDGNLNTIVLNGFSKSGTGIITLENDTVYCRTRYNQVDTFSFDSANVDQVFEGIAYVAWGWYISFKNREPFGQPAQEWVPNWLDYGLIAKVETPTYVICN